MQKQDNKGFMLAETLIVTTFVAGVLIFLFIQFTNLSKSYEESYNYNTPEALYALEDIKEYIISDTTAYTDIENNITNYTIKDITDCSIFTNQDYCLKLFSLENISNLIISTNMIYDDNFSAYDEEFLKFITKISEEGNEKYRIIAKFNNNTYATIRFGD